MRGISGIPFSGNTEFKNLATHIPGHSGVVATNEIGYYQIKRELTDITGENVEILDT